MRRLSPLVLAGTSMATAYTFSTAHSPRVAETLRLAFWNSTGIDSLLID